MFSPPPLQDSTLTTTFRAPFLKGSKCFAPPFSRAKTSSSCVKTKPSVPPATPSPLPFIPFWSPLLSMIKDLSLILRIILPLNPNNSAKHPCDLLDSKYTFNKSTERNNEISMKVKQITLQQEPIPIIDYFCYNTPNFQGQVGPVSQKIYGPHHHF